MNAPEGGSIASAHMRLRESLRRNAPELLERYGEVVDGTDVVSQRALMWRFEVESCVSLVRESSNGLVLTYEQLVDDAYVNGESLFRHLGIEFGDATKRFIDGLYGIDSGDKKTARKTGWGSSYYSVYRNPRDQKDSWKQKIRAEDRLKVESIVQGNEAVEFCASLGAWW